MKELSDVLTRIIKLYKKTENNIVAGASKFPKIIDEIRGYIDDNFDIVGRLPAGLFDDTSCYDGASVNMCMGNFVDNVVEISFGKHLNLQFARNYNSFYRTVGCMGPGWSHNYEISLDIQENKIIMIMGDGASEEYLSTDGIRYISKFGGYSYIEKNEKGYVFTNKLSQKMLFDLEGVLLSIRDFNNNSIQFEYEKQRHSTILIIVYCLNIMDLVIWCVLMTVRTGV